MYLHNIYVYIVVCPELQSNSIKVLRNGILPTERKLADFWPIVQIEIQLMFLPSNFRLSFNVLNAAHTIALCALSLPLIVDRTLYVWVCVCVVSKLV